MGAFTERQKRFLDETGEKWKALKSVIDECPESVSFKYVPEKGYVITFHIDYLALLEEV